MRSVFFNAILLASLLTLSHGLLKWVANHSTGHYLQTLQHYGWLVGIAIGLYGFIFLYYAYVLQTVAIAVLYPIYTGLSIILVLLMGAGWFGEVISLWQLLGCALIIGGIFLVSGAVG